MPGQPVQGGFRPFKAGNNFLDEFAAERMNQMLAIAARQTEVGWGLKKHDGGNGPVIEVDRKIIPNLNLKHAFKLIDYSTDSSIDVRVVYGTLAGSAPSGMSAGDDPEYIITGLTGTGKIWGGISRDAGSGAITSRYVDSGSSIPDDDDENGYIELGSYSISSGTLSLAQTVSGSQAYQYCMGHNWGLI